MVPMPTDCRICHETRGAVCVSTHDFTKGSGLTPNVAAMQDEKVFRVVRSRERWFQIIMGEGARSTRRPSIGAPAAPAAAHGPAAPSDALTPLSSWPAVLERRAPRRKRRVPLMLTHRGQAIAESQFPWEQDALLYVRGRLPDQEPVRAWANVEFLSLDGHMNEVDLIVLTAKGLFLIEIK